MQTSVDGYVGRAGEGPDWQVWNWGPECPWDAPLKARFNALFRDIDTILLSRKILEGGYLDHWSQFARDYGDNPDFAFARRIVEARKVVFSNTLQKTKWPGTELARRPLVEEVDALKAESGRDLIAFGGAGFASALVANDLVDEYQFYVNPVPLREGLSIFKERGIDSNLDLREAEVYACGIVVIRYDPPGREGEEGMKRVLHGGYRAAQPTSLFSAGHVFEIGFAPFTPRITIRSERELTVEIIAGDNIGFSDTCEYETVAVRDDVIILSWQEHNGSTIVHVLDLSSCNAYTAVTPGKGGFMRLTGRIEVKSDV
jgi:dihydrofolate reductase